MFTHQTLQTLSNDQLIKLVQSQENEINTHINIISDLCQEQKNLQTECERLYNLYQDECDKSSPKPEPKPEPKAKTKRKKYVHDQNTRESSDGIIYTPFKIGHTYRVQHRGEGENYSNYYKILSISKTIINFCEMCFDRGGIVPGKKMKSKWHSGSENEYFCIGDDLVDSSVKNDTDRVNSRMKFNTPQHYTVSAGTKEVNIVVYNQKVYEENVVYNAKTGHYDFNFIQHLIGGVEYSKDYDMDVLVIDYDDCSDNWSDDTYATYVDDGFVYDINSDSNTLKWLNGIC